MTLGKQERNDAWPQVYHQRSVEPLKTMGSTDLKKKLSPGPAKSFRLKTWHTKGIPFSILDALLETEGLIQQ